MAQSKLRSFSEAAINIAIGSVVALCSQLYLFPIYGIYVSLETDLWLTLWFTVISLVRSYVIRRIMNKHD